jgi:TolB-like protein
MLLVVTSMVFAQKSIAVSTFDITGGAVSSEEAEAITELFISELVATGKVNVVDRANFDKIIKEMKFQSSDWSNSEKTAALGNAVNANMVVRGQIIKLGSKMYLSATIIDVKTANVLSSAREQFNSLDDIFGLLTNFATKTVEGLSLKIGDIGPGGGIVFYIEGKKAYEVSEILGEANWETAKTIAKNFRGGDYSDWYLPTKDQLNLVYKNLRKTGKISGNSWHWSSAEYNDIGAWFQEFSDGSQSFGYKIHPHSVRAIRAFNY